jgi:hypothetical protein
MKDVNRKQLQKEKALKEGTLLEEPTMNTSNIYPEVSETPNQDLSNFEAIMTGGERLGFSGADGNTAGNADIGLFSGLEGVALSPPHPVTGVRIHAVHVTTGLGNTTPLRPGVTISRGFSDNPPQYTMGSVLWFYDSDFNNGAGQPAGKWCNLEYSNFEGDSNGKWFFWDTIKTGQFAGIYKVETDLSLHPCGDISDLIDGLNFPGIGGSLGAAKIPVLTVKGLETEPIYPGPIANLFGLGQRGIDWLLDKINQATKPLTNPFQSLGMPFQIATSVGKNEPEVQPEPSNVEKQEFLDGVDPDWLFNNDKSNINPKNNQPYVTKGIPINDEKQPYSDENFYVDPITGRVTAHTEESRNKYPPNTVNQDKTKYSTLGARGESFGQIYKNEKGEWVYSFEDHAYHNLNSSDVGETEGGAGAISNEIHKNADKKHGRNQGGDGPDNTSPNTGGMSGYPCNSSACIRGDSIIKFEIPVSEIRNTELRNAINSKIGERNKNNSKNESYISESAKLGHFEPDILDVDINDIRKGIMPEYPKQPPAEMIDGYHQKSALRPKPLDNEPYVKITKVDLIRNHRIKPSEADEMMDTINRLNDYIKKHPEDLIYVQQRYPKDDPRLAELNWKMDQMLNASEDYLDKNFKENKKLFNRAIDRTKNNIKLTDPKYAQQRYDELRGTTKPKKTNLVGRLGKHLNKYESKGILRHVDSDDFKKINERKNEEKEQIKKIQEQAKEIQKEIKIEFQEKKNDWRKDLGNITY